MYSSQTSFILFAIKKYFSLSNHLLDFTSGVHLQCCVSLRCTAECFNYTYTYIYYFSVSFLFFFFPSFSPSAVEETHIIAPVGQWPVHLSNFSKFSTWLITDMHPAAVLRPSSSYFLQNLRNSSKACCYLGTKGRINPPLVNGERKQILLVTKVVAAKEPTVFPDVSSEEGTAVKQCIVS